MPRWLKIFLLVLVLLFAGAIALLQTPRPLEYILAKVLQRQIPDAAINSLHVSSYRIKDQKVFLDQLSIDFSLKGVDYMLHSDLVTVGSWRAILGNFSNEFTVKGVHLVSKDIKFSNGSAKIFFEPVSKEQWTAHGHARFPVGSYTKQGITELEFDFLAKPKQFTFKDIQANALKGKINGEFVLEYKPELAYSMDIILAGIDTTALPVQADISQQLKGIINGSLKILGTASSIDFLDAKVNAPKGAFVNPYLLKLLTDYIPQSIQKKQMEAIIKSGRQVFMDRFIVNIKNDKNKSLNTAFDLKSVEFNLDVNLKVDINVDGGINSLFLNFINQYHK